MKCVEKPHSNNLSSPKEDPKKEDNKKSFLQNWNSNRSQYLKQGCPICQSDDKNISTRIPKKDKIRAARQFATILFVYMPPFIMANQTLRSLIAARRATPSPFQLTGTSRKPSLTSQNYNLKFRTPPFAFIFSALFSSPCHPTSIRIVAAFVYSKFSAS